MIPNLEALVATVAREHPAAWRHAHTGDAQTEDFIRLLAARAHAVNPAFGLNGKRGNPADISDDVLNFSGEGAQFDPTRGNAPVAVIDVIASAGWVPGFPEPSPAWQVMAEPHAAAWVQPAAVVAPSATALGVSLFWSHAGTAKYQEQLQRNCAYAAQQIGATFVRWFFTVGGDLFSGADPWRDAGAFFDQPGHEDVARRTLALLQSFGLRSHLVLVGSRRQADTDAQRDAIVDRAVRVIRGHEAEFICVETHNEYEVNQSFSHDCRNMARRLKSQLPAGFPIALSSPNSVMGGNEPAATVLAEIEKMYGGDSGANVLTEHNTRPEPVWNPETLRRAGVTLPILCGEPRGPGASAGGDVSDPAMLDGDFAAAQRGGAIGYVYHPMPGIWGGHCHPQFGDQNRWANFEDVPNAPAIARTLKARATSGAGPGLPPQPPGGDDMQPYVDEGKAIREYKPPIVQAYADFGFPLDDEYPVWFMRLTYSLAGGMPWDTATARHLGECRAVLAERKTREGR